MKKIITGLLLLTGATLAHADTTVSATLSNFKFFVGETGYESVVKLLPGSESITYGYAFNMEEKLTAAAPNGELSYAISQPGTGFANIESTGLSSDAFSITASATALDREPWSNIFILASYRGILDYETSVDDLFTFSWDVLLESQTTNPLSNFSIALRVSTIRPNGIETRTSSHIVSNDGLPNSFTFAPPFDYGFWDATPGTEFAFTFELNAFNYAIPIPEPKTYGLLLLGLGVIGFTARRNNRI